ncbi:hypothetical protein SUGI_1198750 [Cryptomeria japonica]|nr:hypothetical protein SUGI_1198750 [Cryptomeria japonica]
MNIGNTLKLLLMGWCILLLWLQANFARWEPAHGPFGFKYPWLQYLKIGAAMRYCAYCVEALNGCLNSETMAPQSVPSHMRAPFMQTAAECSKVLRQLADSIKSMTKNPNSDLMIDQLNRVVEELQNYLISHPQLFIDSKRCQIIDDNVEEKNSKETTIIINIMDGLAVATVACLLKEIVGRLSTVIKAVDDLGKRANFKLVENNQIIIPSIAKKVLHT